MKYFDAHCHLQFDAYDADRDEVLKKMQDAEIGGLIVGVDLDSSQKALELVREQHALGNTNVYASVGLHPNDVLLETFNESLFAELAAQPEVVAIGECGLDYYRPEDVSKAKLVQRDIFEKQIELAVKYDKPLMIHSRPSKGTQDAYYDTLDLLRSKKREYGDKVRGDMHFFVGGIAEAKQFVEFDFSLSYTAVITFARDYDEVIRYVPLTSLLSETDSPYVAPAPNRGRRNDPLAVKTVVEQLAQIRGEEVTQVQQTILSNACTKLRISL